MVATGVTYQGGVNGMLPGVPVPALYEANLNVAYPPHTSLWIASLVGVGVGVFGLFRWRRLLPKARSPMATF